MAPNTNDFNADELEAPQWLDADFFTKVLRESENDAAIEVCEFKLTPGTGKGDHYASVMFRAVVDFKQQGEAKTKSMIIKTMPADDSAKKELLGESHIFETEIGMYTEVIPKFEAVLRSVGDHTVLGGRCLYHSLSPKQVIVFEDVCPLGYTVLRDRQLTLEEVQLAYLKLAKWHAISYKLNLENPRFFDKYRHSIFGLKDMVESDMWTGGISKFIEMLDRTPNLVQYKPHFEALQANLIEKCVASFDEYRRNPQENAMYVLAHGDFHYKNMMFKHCASSGRLEDIMLLDFQLCFMGPIMTDLHYSFVMVLNAEQRANHRDELIHYYFTNFIETLQKIGFEGRLPTLLELRTQLMQHKHFELFLLTTFLPAWIHFQKGDVDYEAMMGSVDYRRSFYCNQEYVEEVQRVLPKLLHLGYFDN